jgi:2-polyprenyl-3-methyl-5-hydroxy-6-metoxy-1,4-benzoquinol methylase
LEDDGYKIKQFDPFFHNDIAVLRRSYDYIVCCEVIEHFHSPSKEFELINIAAVRSNKIPEMKEKGKFL